MMFSIIFTRRKGIETELALYRYWFTYCTGFSGRICIRQTAPVSKNKRKYHFGKLMFTDSARPDK